MRRIAQIAGNPPIRALLEQLPAQMPALIELAIAVQQIPAPTFSEAKRADFIETKFNEIGLQQISQDSLNNVYGCLGGASSESCLVISAHSDTVFSSEVDLTVRQEENRLYGAGLADNSLGVAGLIWLAQNLVTAGIYPQQDIWFVANSAEEGLGDLKGMQAIVGRFGENASYLVIEGGVYGQIYHRAIGSKRYKVAITTPGGHSWGDFGMPSAIHALGRIIADISYIKPSKSPKVTFNVGVIRGGTTVNSIAANAEFLLDLRANDGEKLLEIEAQVKKIVAKHAQMLGVTAQMSLVGDRPAGQIARDMPLVKLATDVLKWVGCRHIRYPAGSTDANIPLSLGMPAICIGLATSANAHRQDEYFETNSLPQGMSQLLLLTLLASELVPDRG